MVSNERVTRRGYDSGLWQYRLWSFQVRDTKLKILFAKNQLQSNENTKFVSCRKVPKFDFQSQFSMSKITAIFLNLFSLNNTNLGAHFFIDIF